MADGSDAGKIELATMNELRAYLREQSKAMKELARWAELRNREFPNNFGSTGTPSKVQPGANGQPLLEFPKDGCAPILDALTFDIDWDFDNDMSGVNHGVNAQATMEGAFLSIYWGGISHRCDFDLMRGTSVTVAGFRGLLKVTYPQLPADGEGIRPFQPILNVRASVGLGTKPTSGIIGNARRTFDLGTIAAGAVSPLIEIPPWCKEIGISNLQITVPNMTCSQFPNNNAGAQANWIGSVGKGPIDMVPRSSWSNWVSFTNISGVPINAKVIFYLGK